MNKQEKINDIKLNLREIINMSDEFNKYDLLITAIRYNKELDYNLSLNELRDIIQSIEFELQLFDLGFNVDGYTFHMTVKGQYIEYNTYYNTLHVLNVDEVTTKNINTIKQYVNYYKGI